MRKEDLAFGIRMNLKRVEIKTIPSTKELMKCKKDVLLVLYAETCLHVARKMGYDNEE